MSPYINSHLFGSTPAFTFSAKTDNAGTSNSTSYSVPTESVGTYTNISVDWGNGDIDTGINTWNDAKWTHDYGVGNEGTYIIKITGDVFKGFRVNNAGDKSKLLDISEWGLFAFSNTGGANFYGANNFTCSATDIPDCTDLTSMFRFIRGASKIVSFGNLDEWDTSNVTRYSEFAYDAILFNDPSSGIMDVSGITGSVNLDSFYRNANAMNHPISWTLPNLLTVNLQRLCYSAQIFDNVITLDWSKVSNASQMAQLTALGTTNWSNLLNDIDGQTHQNNIIIHGGNATYNAGAATSRANLVIDGWTITDNGPE